MTEMPVLLAVASVLAAGGFVAFPWGHHSPGQVVVASVLWAVSAVMFLVAVIVARRMPEQRPTEPVIAESMVSTVGVAPPPSPLTATETPPGNTGTQDKPPVVLAAPIVPSPDRRTQFMEEIRRLHQEGQKIIGDPVTLIDFPTESKRWTKATFDFLEASLGPGHANTFYYQWSMPDDTSVAIARTAHIERLQVLAGIVAQSANLPLLESWQP